jgi:Dimethlysulfonioproprionate lyase
LNWPHPRGLTKQPAFRLPACSYLDQALENARIEATHGLCESVASLLAALRWSYGYPPHPAWPSLPSRIAFAQIVGPNGLSDDRAVHLGLTLLAPHTHYPLHSHPAVELYLVLSGAALWRTSGHPFTRRQPGSVILHPTNIGHAMETANEPLLALYTWRGDLAIAPVYAEE